MVYTLGYVPVYLAEYNKSYAVFGVEADWKRDTAETNSEHRPWSDLLKDSAIVLLESIDYEAVAKGVK